MNKLEVSSFHFQTGQVVDIVRTSNAREAVIAAENMVKRNPLNRVTIEPAQED